MLQDRDSRRTRILRSLVRLSVVLLLPALALVVWGELVPGGGIPGVWDKLQHFTAYLGLSGMATLAAGRKHALWTALALVFMGGVLEIVQGFVGRDASFWDEFANSLGVILGTVTALAITRFLSKRQLS